MVHALQGAMAALIERKGVYSVGASNKMTVHLIQELQVGPGCWAARVA